MPSSVRHGVVPGRPQPSLPFLEAPRAEAPALYMGDRLRVSVDFIAEIQSAPTAVLAVAVITTIPDGTKVLGPAAGNRARPRAYRARRAVRQ